MNTIKIKEAAHYLGLSEYMVRKLCRGKAIPHIKAGGIYLFRMTTLDEWLAKQEKASLSSNYEEGGKTNDRCH